MVRSYSLQEYGKGHLLHRGIYVFIQRIILELRFLGLHIYIALYCSQITKHFTVYCLPTCSFKPNKLVKQETGIIASLEIRK